MWTIIIQNQSLLFIIKNELNKLEICEKDITGSIILNGKGNFQKFFHWTSRNDNLIHCVFYNDT